MKIGWHGERHSIGWECDIQKLRLLLERSKLFQRLDSPSCDSGIFLGDGQYLTIRSKVNTDDSAGQTDTITVPQSFKSKSRTSWVLRYGLVAVAFTMLGVALARTLLWPVQTNGPINNDTAQHRSLPRRFVVYADVAEDARPSISPDGGMIAFEEDGNLWVRDLYELEARELPGTEGGMNLVVMEKWHQALGPTE